LTRNLGRLDVVIVNFNGGRLLADCVGSLIPQLRPTDRLFVVDNGSEDDSLRQLPHDVRIGVTRLARNSGFASGANYGARLGDAELLLFLNSDCRLDEPGCIEALRVHLTENEVAAVVPRIFTTAGVVEHNAWRLPTARSLIAEALAGIHLARYVDLDRWNDVISVEAASGAAFMIKRSIFENVGGFDESFFMYVEDLELSARLRTQRYHIDYLPDACLTHVGGGSSRTNRAALTRMHWRNREEFCRRHLPTVSKYVAVGALRVRAALETRRAAMAQNSTAAQGDER
jgi:GT2 family glycosyltransferase